MSTKKRDRKKEENDFFMGGYGSVFRYLNESRIQIAAVFLVFVFFIALGFFYPFFFEEQIMNLLKTLIEQTKNLGMLEMTLFIFKNNLYISLVCLFSGIFLGILPSLSAVINGYVLGFVSRLAVGEAGYSSLLRLLPHGIFEIPAVIISLGLGIRLGLFWLAKKPQAELCRRLRLSLLAFMLAVLPLLIIAAIIEGVLTVFWG